MNILFYGDSNTWGTPGDRPGERIAADRRFTGLVAQAFPQHHIIEEGLPGRTVCSDDPMDDCRNGLRGLSMVLQTHEPIDLMVIMLGTNDTKIMFQHTPVTIGMGMEKMIRDVRDTAHWSQTGKCPDIALIAPPSMGDIRSGVFYGMFDEHSAEMISGIAAQYAALAARYGCHFFDGSRVAARACCDRVHLTEDEHAEFAQMLIPWLREQLRL